jgi:hypothetical protein
MLTSNLLHITILGVLILITFANFALIAFPFGSQAEAATALNNTKPSAIDAIKNITKNLVNISATTPLQVVSPPAEVISPNGFAGNPAGQLVFYVTFNKPVDRSTLIPGTSLIMSFPKNLNAPVTVTYGFDDDVVKIVTNNNVNELCIFQPDCVWTLALDGTAPNSVKATDGALLNDGFRDYWTGFVIVG